MEKGNKTFIYSVCRKFLSEQSLPDVKGFVEDNLYHLGCVCIVHSVGFNNEEITLRAIHGMKCFLGDKMSENEDGNNQMDAEDEKERKSDSECGNLSYLTCPVCGELLHEENLPDMESVIYDSLYYGGDNCIGSLKVRLYCVFEHRSGKEGVTIEEPHIWWAMLIQRLINQVNAPDFLFQEYILQKKVM